MTVALAADELELAASLVEGFTTSGEASPWECAVLAQAEGEVALARGQGALAIERLQTARTAWAELDAPYEQASACLLLGRGLVAVGDTLVATLEFEAARGIFERMGASEDRRRAEELLAGRASEARGEAPPAPTPEPRLGEGEIRRDGDLWAISLDGATVRLKESKGIVYLARLLSEPGLEHFAIELAGGAAPFSDAGELLDTEARQAYRERLGELRVELEQAEHDNDLGRSESCRRELEELASQLAAAVGLGGRVRRAGDPNERARQSVTKAITRTIHKLAAVDERLGRHLGNTVRTGVTCRYEPDPGRPVTWRVEVG